MYGREAEFENLVFHKGSEGLIEIARGIFKLAWYFKIKQDNYNEIFNRVYPLFRARLMEFAKVVSCYKEPASLEEAIELLNAFLSKREDSGCRKQRSSELDFLSGLFSLFAGR